MIEPLPFVYKRLVDRYSDIPGLMFANVAIDSEPGMRPFYHLRPDDDPGLPPWYDQLGSFLKDNVLKHQAFLPSIPERLMETPVQCMRFEDLCEQYELETFDLLHIDAEGYDYQILRTVDLARFRPVVVLYEHRHLSDEDTRACHDLLEAAGYDFFRDTADTLAIQRQILDEQPKLARAWAYVRDLANRRMAASSQ